MNSIKWLLSTLKRLGPQQCWPKSYASVLIRSDWSSALSASRSLPQKWLKKPWKLWANSTSEWMLNLVIIKISPRAGGEYKSGTQTIHEAQWETKKSGGWIRLRMTWPIAVATAPSTMTSRDTNGTLRNFRQCCSLCASLVERNEPKLSGIHPQPCNDDMCIETCIPICIYIYTHTCSPQKRIIIGLPQNFEVTDLGWLNLSSSHSGITVKMRAAISDAINDDFPQGSFSWMAMAMAQKLGTKLGIQKPSSLDHNNTNTNTTTNNNNHHHHQ